MIGLMFIQVKTQVALYTMRSCLQIKRPSQNLDIGGGLILDFHSQELREESHKLSSLY